MDPISDLSNISDSESFEDAKYEHKTSKRNKRKPSRSHKETRQIYSGDNIADIKILVKREVDSDIHYDEIIPDKVKKSSSKHKNRKHRRKEKETMRSHSVSSNSSINSESNSYYHQNNHRSNNDLRQYKSSDSNVHRCEELGDTNMSSSKRHKSRHKHSSSSKRRHQHKTSQERHGRRLEKKRHHRSVNSSPSSSDELHHTKGKKIPNGQFSFSGMDANISKWEEEAGGGGSASESRMEVSTVPVKSEPISGSESDERPTAPATAATSRASSAQHRECNDHAEDDYDARGTEERSHVQNSRNGSQENGRVQWGKQEVKKEEEKEPEEKAKPNLGLSGKLTQDANTYKGVVIKYSQPSEARKPKRRWRWYIFKGDEELPYLPLHRQSAYLIGRERRVVDVATDHPSCSKQHAVLQYRLVRYTRDDGTVGRTVKPYIIDLDSANGTYVNNRRITARSYVELLEKDVVKFGYSSREYVLLHETSKDSDADTADAGLDMSPVSTLMSVSSGAGA